MATLTELQEVDPAGDFYSWILKRYQRTISRLVIFMAVITVGLVLMAFWFDSRLSAIEDQTRAAPGAVQGPTVEQWQESVDQSAQRDAALQSKVDSMAGCLNGNLQAFDTAMQQLLLGRMQVREFVSGFKLRSCS
ncbi:MAG TPA: hypothetical protein VE174_13115 [Actinomycetota bacterium]|nr:hypothetical protein [Actinomycetota bacterium]